MEDFLSLSMPHSPEAEQAVIGAMLIDARCIPSVVEAMRGDDFYLAQNRDIYETIYAMFALGRPIDPVTVLGEMQTSGRYEESSTRAYLTALLEATPTAAHVAEYMDILRDRSLLRKLGDVADDISTHVRKGEGEGAAVLEAAEQSVYAIRQGRADQTLKHVGVVLPDVYRRLDFLSRNRDKLPGVTTGLAALDQVIGGLGKSNLVLIAARPGMGKTSMGLNVAVAAAKETKQTVVFFSLEMSLEQLTMRMLSTQACVDSKAMLTGRLEEEDWIRLADASDVLGALDIRLDEHASITVPEMKAKCRRLDNLGLIVIDYLQLMQGSKRTDNRVQEVSEISRALKIMAKELDVPVVCMSQLSRANESRANKRPQLSDLRESGAIEQDADVVMFLYRDEYYNEDTEDKNIAELIVAKNRHGETGTVKLHWMSQYTSFSTIEYRQG